MRFHRKISGKCRMLAVGLCFGFIVVNKIYVEFASYQVIDPKLVLLNVPRTLEALLPPPGEEILKEPDISGVTGKTLLVVVHSGPTHFKQRDFIRKTWGQDGIIPSQTDEPRVIDNVKVIFCIGLREHSLVNDFLDSKLKHEIGVSGDILFLNMIDHYDNLSIKNLMWLKWVTQKLPEVKYILKTDDDIIANVYGWVHIIDGLDQKPLKAYIVGHVFSNSRVKRSGKYVVSRSAYPYPRYPPYCPGSGYLITREAAVAIVEADKYVPMTVRDDVHFTGILADMVGVTLVRVPPVTYVQETKSMPDMERPLLVLHSSDLDIKMAVWQRIVERQKNSIKATVRFQTLKTPKRVHFLPLSNVLNISLVSQFMYESDKDGFELQVDI